MTTAIKARGETPFPEAGEGVVLCFRNQDIARIEEKLGDDWFTDLIAKAQASIPSIKMMMVLVENGAKKDRQPYVIPEEVLDTIPQMDLGNKLLDAACLSQRGQTLKDYLGEMFEAMADQAAKGDEDPQFLSPGAEATSSDAPASGPESGSKNSGTSLRAKRGNS